MATSQLLLPRAVLRPLAATLLTLGLCATAHAAPPAARQVTLDRAAASKPVDRFFDLSVGADYPGTTGRPENLAQLKTAADELGFRYLRFHDIFHDSYGTVKKDGDKLVFDWTGIDKLYDAMLARGIKPFIELGFTPGVMKTSPLTISYWKGNTSHPQPGPNGAAPAVKLALRNLKPGAYPLELRRTGYKANDAHTAYLEMGAPKQLDAAQLGKLQSLTQDLPELKRTVYVGKNGRLNFTVPMRSNDIALLTLEPEPTR